MECFGELQEDVLRVAAARYHERLGSDAKRARTAGEGDQQQPSGKQRRGRAARSAGEHRVRCGRVHGQVGVGFVAGDSGSADSTSLHRGTLDSGIARENLKALRHEPSGMLPVPGVAAVGRRLEQSRDRGAVRAPAPPSCPVPSLRRERWRAGAARCSRTPQRVRGCCPACRTAAARRSGSPC